MGKHTIDTNRAIDEIEGRKPLKPGAADAEGASVPAAGPHATEALTRHDSTPGAGALPDASPEIDGGAG